MLTPGLMVRVIAVWMLVAGLAFYRARGAIPALAFNDPDDALRLLQVRNLIGGQGWFDLRMHAIDPPLGVPMHWSRLVDVPIAALILLLRPLFGQGLAEQAALAAVPALTLLAAMTLTATLAKRLAGDAPALIASLLWLLAFAVLPQFAPLRIDHHAWQIVALLAAANAAFVPDPRKSGWLAGAAIAAGLAISLELLPYAALFAALFGLRAMRDPARRAGLVALLDALAGSSAVLFLATRGPDPVPWCDTASWPYVAALAFAGFVVRIGQRRAIRPLGVMVLLGLTGIATAAVFLALAPQCNRGPFAALDPLVYSVWYANVLEGLPVWRQPLVMAVQFTVPPLVALGCCAFLWRKRDNAERGRDWAEFALLVGGFWAVSLVVSRAGAAAGALSIVPVAAAVRPLLQRIEAVRPATLRVPLLAALLAALLPGFTVLLAQQAIPALAPPANSDANGIKDKCGLPGSLETLAGLPHATLFAPMDLGPAILLHTDHSVVATGHHRASAAMHDLIAAFMGSDAEARRLVTAHGARYVLSCADLSEATVYRDKAPRGLMARLLASKPPQWLRALPTGPEAGSLRVWEVMGR